MPPVVILNVKPQFGEWNSKKETKSEKVENLQAKTEIVISLAGNNQLNGYYT